MVRFSVGGKTVGDFWGVACVLVRWDRVLILVLSRPEAADGCQKIDGGGSEGSREGTFLEFGASNVESSTDREPS